MRRSFCFSSGSTGTESTLDPETGRTNLSQPWVNKLTLTGLSHVDVDLLDAFEILGDLVLAMMRVSPCNGYKNLVFSPELTL